VFAEASYDVALERLLVTPFAGVSYVALHTDGFSESGGPSALTAASETTETTFTTLGVRGAATVFDTVSIHSMAGWRHAFGDINPVSVFTLDGSDPFSIIGAPIAEDAFVTEFGLNAAVTETATIGVSYQGQIAHDANAHGVFGRVFVRF
jgi:fibronectin-binding autotransporter adhesin